MEETMMKRPRSLELLAPAGDMERLTMAVLYGADAVYLAGTSYGMRAFAGNFSDEELPQAVAFAHSHGVRVHCTINTMPRNDEAARLPEHLERLADAGVDALIVADLGAFTMAGKYAPRCERHISTQVSICNYETARAWHDLGASRVILARELEGSPDLLVAVHPTRGLDIGATRFVHDTMIEARDKGCGVLLISADFDEILEVSDRIVVMFEGQIMGVFSGKNPPIEEISLAMAGK